MNDGNSGLTEADRERIRRYLSIHPNRCGPDDLLPSEREDNS